MKVAEHCLMLMCFIYSLSTDAQKSHWCFFDRYSEALTDDYFYIWKDVIIYNPKNQIKNHKNRKNTKISLSIRLRMLTFFLKVI